MKKFLPLSLALSALLLATSPAQIASDNASNYGGTWVDGNNGGSGFQAWNLYTSTTNGTAGHFLGDSAAQGFGDINTAGVAFGMFGNPTGGNYSNAERLFSNSLNNGNAFLIDVAVAFRNGAKGISLFVGGDFSGPNQVWNFNVGGDQYQVNGADLGWAYNQQSIFEITATQISATSLQVSMVRGSDTFTDTYTVASPLTGFRLYVGDTEAGNDLNNLYSNNLAVIPEPATWALLGLGAMAWIVRRKTKSLT